MVGLRGRECQGFALGAVALVALVTLAGGASAHVSEEHGRVTLHDQADGEAKTSNESTAEPARLTCEFWVRGHDVSHRNGSVNVHHGPGSTVHVHHLDDWEAEANGSDVLDFEAGSFTLHESGSYELWVLMGEEHAAPSHDIDYRSCGGDSGAPDEDCPDDLRAQARPNGEIAIQWAGNETSYVVERRSADGFERVAEVQATFYVDQQTRERTTYHYRVSQANQSAEEARTCPVVEATAIPFFDGPAFVGLALAGGLAVVAVHRRAS